MKFAFILYGLFALMIPCSSLAIYNLGPIVSNTSSLPSSRTYQVGQFTLIHGQSVQLAGGVHFDMQNDGNFVVYTTGMVAVWNTATNMSCSTANCKIIFQTDGNLVVYSDSSSAPWHLANLIAIDSQSTLKFSNTQPYVQVFDRNNNRIFRDCGLNCWASN